MNDMIEHGVFKTIEMLREKFDLKPGMPVYNFILLWIVVTLVLSASCLFYGSVMIYLWIHFITCPVTLTMPFFC